MHGNSGLLLIILATILFVEVYAFKGMKILVSDFSSIMKWIMYALYWVFPAIVIFNVLSAIRGGYQMTVASEYKVIAYTFALFLTLFVPKLVFALTHLIGDLSYLVQRAWVDGEDLLGNIAGRRKFITQIGLGLAAIPFASFIYGVVKGRYDFRTVKKTIIFQNLPAAFDGYKIVHISDIHIGSFFNNHEAVRKGIDLVNKAEADLVLFTGDMVNNLATELDGWEDLLSGIKAKYGVYSVMGNHDYGDYVRWTKPTDRLSNIVSLQDRQKNMGFKMLINEHVKIHSKGSFINLIGVENWGAKGFTQYGNIEAAMMGIDDNDFNILMSHDPSHWDAQILAKKNIELTLSGHTHGMQMGIEIPGIKWSLVKYRYPRWGGLYTEGNQHLYVNRGFGYIGFPGRVGMPPEITEITLKKA